MASEIKVNKFTGVTTAGSILVTGEGNSTTTNLQQGLVKAWFNFSPNTSNTYRDSFNIDSVTDNSTGDFSHNFTNNMSNDDFSFTTGTNGNSNEGVNSYNWEGYTGGWRVFNAYLTDAQVSYIYNGGNGRF